MNQFVDSAGVGHPQATAPTNHIVEDGAGHHRLLKYRQHGATDIEGLDSGPSCIEQQNS